MTDIKQAKAAKIALQERIRLALREFTEDTGLVVEQVNLDLFTPMDETTVYVVNVDVRL